MAALAKSPGTPGSLRRTLLAAIAWQQLSEPQRKHIDAKKGLGGKNEPSLISEIRRKAILTLEERFLQGTGTRIEDKGPYPT
ncbi:MAG: hypothetical protein ACI8S6_001051 [Myxococcota bacterium]